MSMILSNIRPLRKCPRTDLCRWYIFREPFSSSSSSSSAPADKPDPDKLPNQKDQKDWFNIEVAGDIDERIVPKPVSYRPDHLPQTRMRQKQKPWWKFRYFVDIETLPLPEQESLYTDEPEYPPIFDPSTDGVKKHIRQEWYQAIRRLPTAQQKIYEITKHYGHLSYMLEPVMKQYNFLPAQQFLTRTHLVSGLPDSYTRTEAADIVDEQLGRNIVQMIGQRLYQTKSRTPRLEFKKTSISELGFAMQHPDIYVRSVAEEDILVDVIQMIRNHRKLNDDENLVHLDYNPFVGASWWLSDSPIPFPKKSWFGDKDTWTQCFTYRGDHCLHIRTRKPLAPIVPMDDDLCTKTTVPEWRYNLLQLGVFMRRHNIHSLPGFWPGNSNGFDFPHLIGHNREGLRMRRQCGLVDTDDDQDVMDGMAIMSSFAWLTSLANNLGFTLYDRLTYPLVTQVIITDGQHWSFYVYQLNDHCFHEDVAPRDIHCNNLCWSSGDMTLFDGLDADGRPTNINQDVLNLLVKFATAEPCADVATMDLRPYLGHDDRSQQEIDELNYSLRRKFANYTSNFIARRKKVNLWEKIYKRHKDAPMDPKRTRPKLEFKYPPFFK